MRRTSKSKGWCPVNKSLESRGLLQTTIAALLLVSGLTGCGSEMSTAPSLMDSADESTGEVPVPLKNTKLPTPQNFSATVLTGDHVQLAWKATEVEYAAVIILDGIQIGRVSSRAGTFVDYLGKPSGEHLYTICFVKGDQASRDAHAGVMLREPGEDTGGGRTDDRPERP